MRRVRRPWTASPASTTAYSVQPKEQFSAENDIFGRNTGFCSNPNCLNDIRSHTTPGLHRWVQQNLRQRAQHRGAKTPCTPTCRGLFEMGCHKDTLYTHVSGLFEMGWCKDILYTHVSGLFVNATFLPAASPAVPQSGTCGSSSGSTFWNTCYP